MNVEMLWQVEIVMALEEEFSINVEEDGSQNISTVQEAADLIEKLVQEKKVGQNNATESAWSFIYFSIVTFFNFIFHISGLPKSLYFLFQIISISFGFVGQDLRWCYPFLIFKCFISFCSFKLQIKQHHFLTYFLHSYAKNIIKVTEEGMYIQVKKITREHIS